MVPAPLAQFVASVCEPAPGTIAPLAAIVDWLSGPVLQRRLQEHRTFDVGTDSDALDDEPGRDAHVVDQVSRLIQPHVGLRRQRLVVRAQRRPREGELAVRRVRRGRTGRRCCCSSGCRRPCRSTSSADRHVGHSCPCTASGTRPVQSSRSCSSARWRRSAARVLLSGSLTLPVPPRLLHSINTVLGRRSHEEVEREARGSSTNRCRCSPRRSRRSCTPRPTPQLKPGRFSPKMGSSTSGARPRTDLEGDASTTVVPGATGPESTKALVEPAPSVIDEHRLVTSGLNSMLLLTSRVCAHCRARSRAKLTSGPPGSIGDRDRHGVAVVDVRDGRARVRRRGSCTWCRSRWR